MSVIADSGHSAQRPARRRVLVVDDNKDSAESMSMLLELWGHEVVCAYDGRTALETAANYHPQAVFLDIGLPGMDGYEVAARLRDLPEAAGAVLIAITGYGQDADAQAAADAGFDAHCTKPIGVAQLLNEIDAADTSAIRS